MSELDKRLVPDFASGDADKIRAQFLAYRKPTGPAEAAEWRHVQEQHLRSLGQATLEIISDTA